MRIARSLRNGLACAALLCAACVYQPTDSGRYDNLLDPEYIYCKLFLLNYFAFRDSLPQNPDTFSTAAELYRSCRDTHTVYVNRDSAALFGQTALATRVITGTGIEFDSCAAGIVVAYLYHRSPVQGKRVRPGDTILTINNDTLAGLNNAIVSAKLNGKQGASRYLRVKRDTLFTDTVTVADFRVPSLFADSISAGCAYIFLAAFLDSTGVAGGTAAEFDGALDSLAWADTIILDMQGNRGGILNQGITVASRIFAGKESLFRASTYEGSGFLDSVWTTDSSLDNVESKVLFILANEQTAGVAEVLLAAFKEHGYGERIVMSDYATAGFGFIQKCITTPFGGFAKVTNGTLRTVSGEMIRENGWIKPAIIAPEGQDPLQTVLEQIIFPGNENIGTLTLTRVRKLRNRYSFPLTNHPLCLLWKKRVE